MSAAPVRSHSGASSVTSSCGLTAPDLYFTDRANTVARNEITTDVFLPFERRWALNHRCPPRFFVLGQNDAPTGLSSRSTLDGTTITSVVTEQDNVVRFTLGTVKTSDDILIRQRRAGCEPWYHLCLWSNAATPPTQSGRRGRADSEPKRRGRFHSGGARR